MGGRDCLAVKIAPGSQNKKLSLQTGGTGPMGRVPWKHSGYAAQGNSLKLHGQTHLPVRVVKDSVMANNCLPS